MGTIIIIHLHRHHHHLHHLQVTTKIEFKFKVFSFKSNNLLPSSKINVTRCFAKKFCHKIPSSRSKIHFLDAGTVNCGQKYNVQPGDNCYAISQKFGLDNSAFMQTNNIPSDCKNLQASFAIRK